MKRSSATRKEEEEEEEEEAKDIAAALRMAERAMAASESAPALLLHFPPRYNVHGQKLPVGAGAGLGAAPRKREARKDESGRVVPPAEWEAEPKHETQSLLRNARREANLRELQRASSAVHIRSISELMGSHQVKEVLHGGGFGSQAPDSRSRSNLLRRRREEDHEALKALAARWRDPAQRAVERFDAQDANTAASMLSSTSSVACFELPPATAKPGSRPVSVAQRPRTTTSVPASERTLPQVKLEVIRDRPLPPTLRWVDEPKARKDMLAHRRQAHREALERSAIEARRDGGRPKRQPKRQPREAGPLSHMESEHSDFGKDTKLQFNASTRSLLLQQRKEERRDALEAVRRAKDGQVLDRTREFTGPIVRSESPWWEIGRPETTMARVASKRKELEVRFQERNSVAPSPNGDGPAGPGPAERKRLLAKLPGKVTSVTRSDLSQAPESGQRKVTPHHFTDAVIEFRNLAQMPELDENGKKLTYDPGEDAPLFSCFSEDHIFLEREERQAANEEREMRERLRKEGDKLPLRSFVVSRRPGAPGIRLQGGPSAVARLVGNNPPHSTFAMVRTGGFQHVATRS